MPTTLGENTETKRKAIHNWFHRFTHNYFSNDSKTSEELYVKTNSRVIGRNKLRSLILKAGAALLENIWLEFSIDDMQIHSVNSGWSMSSCYFHPLQFVKI